MSGKMGLRLGRVPAQSDAREGLLHTGTKDALDGVETTHDAIKMRLTGSYPARVRLVAD